MRRPVLTIVLNAVAILLLSSLLVGAIALHRSGKWGDFFSGILSFELDDGFFATDDSFEKGNGSISADEIRNIDLGWASGSVTLRVGEGDRIELTETSFAVLEEDDVMRWKVENGTLTVRFGRRESGLLTFGGNSPEKALTLTVPASLAESLGTVELTVGSADSTVSDLHADRLTATAASGNVTLTAITAAIIDLTSASGSIYGKNLTAEQMNLDSASGNKEFTDCTISGIVECDSASGDFYFSGSLGELDSDTASGDITLHLAAPARHIEIDSASGDLTVTLPADLPGLTAEMDSASGDWDFDFPVDYRGRDRAVYGDGSMKVEIDTASGDVQFNMK